MSSNGKYGERLFKQYMEARGYTVQDVSGNASYFDKDIDFLITSPTTGLIKAFEVKWDSKMNSSGNLFLEMENPRSKQWNGQGWYPHCQADFLVYGDAVARKFYVFPFGLLKQRANQLSLRWLRTRDLAAGYLLPLEQVEDLAIKITI